MRIVLDLSKCAPRTQTALSAKAERPDRERVVLKPEPMPIEIRTIPLRAKQAEPLDDGERLATALHLEFQSLKERSAAAEQISDAEVRQETEARIASDLADYESLVKSEPLARRLFLKWFARGNG